MDILCSNQYTTYVGTSSYWFYVIQTSDEQPTNTVDRHTSSASVWAVRLNTNDPVDDFHEKIPNMAFTVSYFNLLYFNYRRSGNFCC